MYLPRSRIVGSYDTIFNFFEETVVFSPLYILTKNGQEFQFSHILTDICFILFCFSAVFLIVAILTAVRSYAIIILIFIS